MEEDQLFKVLRIAGSVGTAGGNPPPAGSTLDNIIAAILDTVREEMDARLCVLWEASVDLDLSKTPPKGRLYAVHSTFPQELRVQHARFPADLVRDLTGRHFRAASTQGGEARSYDNDFLVTDADAASTAFLREQGLTQGCTARWQSGDANSGAISVYRGGGDRPFNEDDAKKLRRFALDVPNLLNFATDQFVADLMSNVLDALYHSESAFYRPDTDESQFTNLDNVCQRLKKTFACVEASVFLNYKPKSEDSYRLMGTNLPRADIKKQAYTASKTNGLTGYVLATRHPVVVFAEDQLEEISDFYKDICWRDGAGLSADQQPWSDAPRGFLGVPIFGLESASEESRPLLGVVRCSIRTVRYYFSRRDIGILQLVARLIGVWWVRWLGSHNRAERQQLWESMAEISDSLNARVHQVLSGVKTLEGRQVISTTQQQLFEIYGSVVRQSRQTFRGMVGVAFRRVLPGKGVRQFKMQACDPDDETITTTDVWREARIAAEEATRSGEPVSRRLLAVSDDAYRRGTALLCAPVSIADMHFGVLDFVFEDAEQLDALADSLLPWVRTIGRQLALYEFLVEQVIRLEELKASQIQTYANVAHQLKSPLRSVLGRSRFILEDMKASRNPLIPGHFISGMEKLGGAARRTQRVANTMEMLARLVQGRKVSLNIKRTPPEQVFRFAREMLEDQWLTRGAEKNVRVDLTTAAVEVKKLYRHSVRCDHRYLQQALEAVIDNAFKYCVANSTIKFSIERGGKFLLVLRITNVGIFLTEDDARRCTERSFRGEEAQEVDQDGSGLGLWLAKELMERQDGTIRAYRTNDQGETVFEIVVQMVVAS